MHVCGNFWVHVCENSCMYADFVCKSMERFCACLTVFACLTVGSLGAGAPGALDHGPYGPQGPWILC